MIVYNVTVKTETGIAGEYVNWLKEEHIPEIIKTGCFTEARILRLLEIDESDGPTFAVQYHANSKALYNRYIQNFSDEMRKKSADRWGQKVIAFRSVMEVVH